MATYQFSALADGQAISFSPGADVLNFDQSVIAAADIRVTTEGSNTRITVVEGTHAGKDVLLLNTSMLQFNTVNIRFANGSVLLVGDNSTSTAGDNSANTRFGTGGRDQLIGLGGADTLNGGGGDDVYFVSTGDVINDSTGVDSVYSDVSWTFAIGSSLDNLTYIGTASGATLTGNELDNIITGNDLAQASINGRAGNDTMFGMGGNDTFDMSTGGTSTYGNDVIDGGAGVDTIDFGANARSALNINLGAGSIGGGGDAGTGTVAISNVENATGGAFADLMVGNTSANFFFGGDGADTLNGAAGADRLEGGAAADEYVFSVAPGAANADTVVGFATGADRIVLDGAAHANLGANGRFASGDERFHTGTAAAEADDRVIYNPANGQLLYDADGLGGAGAVLIATLPGGSVSATDIHVINGSGSGSSGSSTTGTSGNDSITGSAGNDTIDALGGHDTVSGVEGNDSLVGGDGNDSLLGGPGNDSLSGGAGNDSLHTDGWDEGSASDGDLDSLNGGLGDDLYVLDRNVGIGTADQVAISDAGGVDTVFAKSGSFALGTGIENLTIGFDWTTDGGSHGVGNELDNVITGFQGWWVDNHLEGLAGNDTLLGGDGGDGLEGGAGNDSLVGGADSDWLSGGDGNDTLSGGDGGDFSPNQLDGGAGADHFVFSNAGSLNWISDFASGSDKVRLDATNMTALGTTGNFALNDERFHAGAAAAEQDDRVVWNAATGELWYDANGSADGGTQLITMVTGNVAATDIIVDNGTAPGQTTNGTEANDTLNGTHGNDTINGLGGNDSINGGEGADSLIGGAGNDTLDAGQDTSIGDGAADTLDGGTGDDVYRVSSDGDVILADAGGVDTVVARNADWTLAADLENLDLADSVGSAYDGTGNALDNTISGASEGGTLRGLGGNDLLVTRIVQNSGAAHGGDGNDTLEGSTRTSLFGDAGNDVLIAAMVLNVLTGGAGSDQFVFEDAAGADITDFISGSDKIRLDATTMTALGTSGTFTANDERFHRGAAAAEGDDRVIYDAATQRLWYDADGSGQGQASLIATLQAGATVVEADIIVDNGRQPGQATNGTSGNDSIVGTVGDDTIDGLAGNDRIEGNEGGDLLIGGAGNDTLFPGLLSHRSDQAFDTLDGGLGDDEYHVWNIEDTVLADAGGIDTVYATGDWTLGGGLENLVMETGTGTGNELDNTMVSPQDSGTLFGMGGNDTLVLINGFNSSSAHGGEGNDTLKGGRRSELFGDAGNDLLIVLYPAGMTTMTGGAGADHFAFERGFTNTITDFASGTDKIRLDAQVMTALGTNGNFTIEDERFHTGATAAEADDRVVWDGATNQLWYDADGSGSGQALLIATLQPGASVLATDIIVDNGTPPSTGGQAITGTAGNESLTGTNGNDTLDGLGGNDTLNGLLGDDTYIAQAGDVIQDSGGVDTLQTPSAWNLTASAIENITLTGTASVGIVANNAGNRIIGNSANNSLEGRGGSDTIEGGGGNDYFKMHAGGLASFGFDVIDGGAGLDTVDHDLAQSALNADLAAGTVSGGDAGGGGGMTLVAIESFEGGAFNDRISGSSANNQLFGNAGNDTLIGLAGGDSLSGGDGNDWVEGGSGFDTLVGGLGNDSFVFTSTGGRITDFAPNADQLVFENAVFAGLGAPSDWAAGDGRFRSAAGATSAVDADDRLIYNQTNGNLYYDSDGAGGAASQLVTTIANLQAPTAADISVI